MTETPEPPPPTPSAAALEALPADAWAWLLPHVRVALHEVPEPAVTAAVRRLRTAPTGRLAGGAGRRELVRLLAAGGPIWESVRRRIDADDDVPGAVAGLLRPPGPSGAHRSGGAAASSPPGSVPDGTEARRLRDKLREGRAERDELRRRLEGAQARTTSLEARVAELEGAVRDARARADAAEADLASAATDQQRAVDRERRRRDAEVDRLQHELGELRRSQEQRRVEARRPKQPPRPGSSARPPVVAAPHPADVSGRFVPGRPSRLPEGVAAGTTEALDLLLHPDRLVLIDGYNLTKRAHPELDLEAQRTWLVGQLANLAARRRVRPVVVFDGQGGVGSPPRTPNRNVEVRFTGSGVSADDELVLAVEGTDEPVVVVTEDRELITRVRVSGADVVDSRSFAHVLR